MKSLQDAIYNWLSIKVVHDARPQDQAAKETYKLFYDILKEEHKLENISVEKDEVMYLVHYTQEGKENKQRYPVELIDIMINQMEEEPDKFPNYPED